MTGDPPPPGPGPAPRFADPLAGFLRRAQLEGALEGDSLEAFLSGLRERADRIITDRLGRTEASLRVLEVESQSQKDALASIEGERNWLRETVDALQMERSWLRETADALERERDWLRETLGALDGERNWLRETIGTLEGERGRLSETIATLQAEAILRAQAMATVEEERREAALAHDLLLTHHRELLARTAGQLLEIASLSPLRAQEVRRLLRALADLLGADAR